MLEAIPNTVRPVFPPMALADGEAKGPCGISRVAGILLPVAIAAALSLTVGILVVQFREALAQMGNWGYLSVFLVELVSSASLMIPLPGPAYTFAMSATLNPFVVGLLGGIAAGVGELVGYYLGVKGGGVVTKGRMYQRLQEHTKRWGGGALFAFALLPIPFDVAGIWAGVTRYPLGRFLAFVMAGKIIKVTAIATTGFYGVGWLVQLVA